MCLKTLSKIGFLLFLTKSTSSNSLEDSLSSFEHIVKGLKKIAVICFDSIFIIFCAELAMLLNIAMQINQFKNPITYKLYSGVKQLICPDFDKGYAEMIPKLGLKLVTLVGLCFSNKFKSVNCTFLKQILIVLSYLSVDFLAAANSVDLLDSLFKAVGLPNLTYNSLVRVFNLISSLTVAMVIGGLVLNSDMLLEMPLTLIVLYGWIRFLVLRIEPEEDNFVFKVMNYLKVDGLFKMQVRLFSGFFIFFTVVTSSMVANEDLYYNVYCLVYFFIGIKLLPQAKIFITDETRGRAILFLMTHDYIAVCLGFLLTGVYFFYNGIISIKNAVKKFLKGRIL